MGWGRKHVCELAGACKRYSEEPSLSILQQDKFAEAHFFAQQLSSLPNAGGAHNVAAAIAKACGACKGSLDFECAGRDYWQQHCQLMQNHACGQ